jgi:DNA-binding response OmpR family regulator
MRILSIEDHDGIRIALEILLELEGHVVVSVDRGEEALRQLRDPAQDAFDLILLDLTTNGMTADEFLKQLRELGAAGEISAPPVCILSASAHIEGEARRLSTEYFIRKPFDPADLMDTLERLQRRPSAPAGDESPFQASAG